MSEWFYKPYIGKLFKDISHVAEFEKDLKVYLHEKEAMDKKALEGLFEKREEGAEE